MKIGYYLSDLTLTGGTKVINQHLQLLDELGYQAKLFVKNIQTQYPFHKRPIIISDTKEIAGQVDIIISTRLRDLKSCLKPQMPSPVMFYQRHELNDLRTYYSEKAKRAKYASLAGRFFLKTKSKLQKIGIEKYYNSKIIAWTPCHIVAHEFTNKYNKDYDFIRNTVNHSLFDSVSSTNKVHNSILSIGDYRLNLKNIARVFEAIKEIKKTTPIHFIRVSPTKIHPEEIKSGIVDEYYSQLNEKEMAILYGKTNIVVSPSLSEGFGMPALEGMAAGCLCVLSDIPAHNMFQNLCKQTTGSYALYFNPESTEELTLSLQTALKRDKCEKLIKNGKQISLEYTSELQKQDLLTALNKIEKKGYK
ncbi:glycosyltransferase [Desulfovibrio gilichinskyi]|uniref:Glycosyltransferase involved in cell wall bisynthesis n=1 Tax=Desulfovibrio gilichinskyi TaxID=1519643 RepID=A0A1X7EKG8_9BACT|nr:glycosyltransferase [Desulfovibrio gilichinskyi]SMF35316.1 Glycosyltransferase involved in cell wall bisynthesis [Desulfovibrio gilichinskyi]